MTVAVAAHTADGIVVAADTQSTDGQLKIYSKESKLHITGQYVMAVAGAKRVGQVVKFGTVWPEPPAAAGDPEVMLRFLVGEVVPAIQQACRAAGVLTEENSTLHMDATVLLVVAGTIAEIEGDGCVHIDRAGRWAIGSGALLALGYLGETGPWVSAQVVEAAHRAVRADLGCGGGVDVVTIPTEPDLPTDAPAL